MYRTRCPSLASGHRRCVLCSRHPHRTITVPLLPSCRAIARVETRSLRSQCARCPSLAGWFGVRPPPLLCSRRPHRTFTIPLSPSCRAIVRVETRSLCAHGARCPSLASSRRHRRCCVLAVQIGRLLYRSRHRAGRTFESRRARCALTVLNALLWRQAAAAAELSPST